MIEAINDKIKTNEEDFQGFEYPIPTDCCRENDSPME